MKHGTFCFYTELNTTRPGLCCSSRLARAPSARHRGRPPLHAGWIAHARYGLPLLQPLRPHALSLTLTSQSPSAPVPTRTVAVLSNVEQTCSVAHPSAFDAPDSAQLLQPSFAVDKRPHASCLLTDIRSSLVNRYVQWMVGKEPEPRRTQGGGTCCSCARRTRDSHEKIRIGGGSGSLCSISPFMFGLVQKLNYT